MTAHITDHKSAALARLAQQLKGKTKLELFMGAFASRYQGPEDALWQLYTERWLDTAVGVQLDVLGRIIGQPRGNSTDDAAYRLRLRARQRANRSSGTVEQILSVFTALGIPVADLWSEPNFPAGFTLHVQDYPTDSATAALYAEFLHDAKLGAVRALLETSEVAAADTFTLASSTKLTANLTQTAGVYQTSAKVTSTAGFPKSGSILLQYGELTSQKRLFYTSKTPTSFEGITAKEGTTANFSSGALVIGVPQPEGELRTDFEAAFPASMPLYSAKAFPDSGFVTLGYGVASVYRVFSYTSKTSDTLEGVSATDAGSGNVFSADGVVVGCSQSLGSTVDRFGGHLATIREV